MRSRPVLAALAVTALAATAALPAYATPAARSSSVPSSVSSVARPAPPGFHAAVVRAARGHAYTSVVPRASAGSRPIPGSQVSTDLPTRIELQSELVTIPYTVTVPTSSVRDPGVEIALAVGRQGQLVVDTFTAGTPGQTTFTGAVTVPITAVNDLGAGAWVVAYGSVSADRATVAGFATTVKIRSLLGESVTRRGSDVEVFGAAKAFDGRTSYLARAGARVYVQRYAGDGRYVNVATALTDARGHIDVSVHIPWRVGIRLYTPDTTDVFGAATAPAAV